MTGQTIEPRANPSGAAAGAPATGSPWQDPAARFREPVLPHLSQAVLDQAYKFSGQCPSKAWLYMLLGLPLSPFAGLLELIAYFIAIIVASLVAGIVLTVSLLIAIVPFIGWLMYIGIAIIVLLVYMAVIFLSPVVAGGLLGAAEAHLGRMGKCRNPAITTVIGAGAGLLGGIGFSIPFIVMTIAAAIGSFGEDMVVSIVVLLIAFLLLLGMFVVGGAIGGYWAINEWVFCESCEEWYGEWSSVAYGTEVLEPLARALNEQDARHAEGIPAMMRITESQYPNVTLKIRKCPRCTTADVQWLATANWQEKKKDDTENKSKEWFKVMLPAEFSRQLEGLVFFQEV